MAQLESIVDTHQRGAEANAGRTEREVAKLWRRYGTTDVASVEFAQFVGAARRLIQTGRIKAASAAEVYYAAVRNSAGVTVPYEFVDASPMDAADNAHLTRKLADAGPINAQKAMMRGSTQASAVRQVASQVADVAGQYVHYADRASVVGTARRDPAALPQRYYRIAHRGCCHLCAIAAARGAVYHTDKRQFHTACKCSVAPALPGQSGPVGVGKRAADEYDALSKELGRAPSIQEFEARWSKVSNLPTTTNAPVPALDRPKPSPAIEARATKLREIAGQYRATAAGYRNDSDPKWRSLADTPDQLARAYEREARVLLSGHPDPTPKLDGVKRFSRRRPEQDEHGFDEIGAALNLADDYRTTNPLYNSTVDGRRPYNVNCTHASTAYELRRRGYDVEAKPIAHDQGRAHEDYANRWTTSDGNMHGRTENRTRSFSEINDVVDSWPDGARGFVTVSWKAGSAHIFNVEKLAGKALYVDGQPGWRWDPDDLARLGKDNGFGLVRVDDLVPTDDVLDLVKEKS